MEVLSSHTAMTVEELPTHLTYGEKEEESQRPQKINTVRERNKINDRLEVFSPGSDLLVLIAMVPSADAVPWPWALRPWLRQSTEAPASLSRLCAISTLSHRPNPRPGLAVCRLSFTLHRTPSASPFLEAKSHDQKDPQRPGAAYCLSSAQHSVRGSGKINLKWRFVLIRWVYVEQFNH